MKFFVRPFFIFIVILSTLLSPLYATEITVKVDRNTINLNESFQLIFSAQDKPDAEPDFTPLDKDFEILSQSQQQSTRISNLKMRRTNEWVLTVMAKRAGNLVIPAIQFGNDTSQFSALIVNEVDVATENSPDLFVQVEVNKTRPYIQEQVIYTLKLHSKVTISQANLTEPSLPNAVIERLGEDKKYKRQYQGESYVVIERQYAVFPQKSEVMRIAPLELTAEVVVQSQGRNNSFFYRQNTRSQRVSSQAITLEVQAKPEGLTNSYWLPAEQVYLEDKWSADLAQVKVGEPITRTLSLLVKGSTQGALPVLYVDNLPADLKAYPDQPNLKETAKDGSIIAYREEKVALIPGAPGFYTLPAIEISWWNTLTQRMEIARIAEKTISVSGVAVVKPVLTVDPEININKGDTRLTESIRSVEGSPVLTNTGMWFWLAIFFAGTWLVTIIYFFVRKSENKHEPVENVKQGTNNKTETSLKKACKNNDSTQAKDALLRWGREQFNESSLTKISEQCSPELQSEILSLNKILYSAKDKEWQGGMLWQAFKDNKVVKSSKSTSAKGEPLPELFNI